MRWLWPRLRRSEGGANAVEFALIAPVFLLIVFGMFEFGLIFNDWLVLTNAAREGARRGVVTDGDLAAKTAVVTTTVNNYASTIRGTLTFDPPVSCFPSDCDAGSSLTVSLKSETPLITPLGEFMSMFGGGIFTSVNLPAKSTMRNE